MVDFKGDFFPQIVEITTCLVPHVRVNKVFLTELFSLLSVKLFYVFYLIFSKIIIIIIIIIMDFI